MRKLIIGALVVAATATGGFFSANSSVRMNYIGDESSASSSSSSTQEAREYRADIESENFAMGRVGICRVIEPDDPTQATMDEPEVESEETIPMEE